MTDDDLLVLWSLGGMELWVDFNRTINVEDTVRHLFLHDRVTAAEIFVMNECLCMDLRFSSSPILCLWETLYIIEDLLSFNPSERWWKLLCAKRWYAKNKWRFND